MAARGPSCPPAAARDHPLHQHRRLLASRIAAPEICDENTTSPFLRLLGISRGCEHLCVSLVFAAWQRGALAVRVSG